MIFTLQLCAGTLLISTIVIVWRRSLKSTARLLSIQGLALGGGLMVVEVNRSKLTGVMIALFVLTLKAIVLPVLIQRRLKLINAESKQGGNRSDVMRDDTYLNPTAGIFISSLLIGGSFVTTGPLFVNVGSISSSLSPTGIAVVLIGFLIIASRRRAISQLIGFVVVDNGITATALFVSGGVPTLVELSASVDVLLVVLILQVFTHQLRGHFGHTDISQLRELHD
ncbi:unnamed protein product [Acidithrix sp. C25]|jgi:hydrogenase-4 component E|nr:unnamed protein product [Acidithrix sp. C25]